MNRKRKHTPVAPGAMTPAQLTRQALTHAAAVIGTTATVAAMLTAFVTMS